MIDYTQWGIEDFIKNESFLHYVLKDKPFDVETWEFILDSHPEIKPVTEKAAQILELLSSAKKPETNDLQGKLNHLRNRMILTDQHKFAGFGFSVRTMKKALQYAAIVLLSVFIGSEMRPYFSNRNNSIQLCKTIVGKGQKSEVILPDNTKVWLNSESELTYPADFGKGKREVSLIGEAYFNVTHDSKHPFLVNAADIKIRVYGTEFNVKCFKDEQIIETTLIKGSLSVSHREMGEGNEILLKPNQQYVYYKNNLAASGITTKEDVKQQTETKKRVAIPTIKPQLIENIDLSPITAWKEKKLVFNDVSFADLAIKLERWYDVKVVIKSEKIKQYRYKGTFENETIEQAISALKLATPFSFTIEKRNIYISE